MAVLDLLPPGPPELRRDWVLHALREAIATGRLRPGDRLIERDLSKETGLSRGPIREAILLLEQEGLVVSQSYRGAQVAEVTGDEVVEMLLPMRMVLERYAFRRAHAKLGEADHEALERLVDQMDAMADAGDTRGVVDTDIRFHEYVITRCGSTQCERSWRSIVARVRAYFYADAPRHGSLHDVTVQHRRLLGAMRGDDEQALLAAVVEHIQDRPVFGADVPEPSGSERAE